jgi:hypothetical protein
MGKQKRTEQVYSDNKVYSDDKIVCREKSQWSMVGDRMPCEMH